MLPSEEKRILFSCSILPFIMLAIALFSIVGIMTIDFGKFDTAISWILGIGVFAFIYIVYLPMQGLLDDFRSDNGFRKDYLEWLRLRREAANEFPAGSKKIPYTTYRQKEG